MQPLFVFAVIILLILLLFFFAKRFDLGRKIYITITILAMISYLIWRVLYTLNLSTPLSVFFSILLYLAEALGVFIALFSMILFFHERTPRKKAPPLKEGFNPSVAILIFTYNEPFKLVVSSALAAMALPYENKKVYICDDGKRELLRQSAERLEIGYITRENNEHAKAGNINHALSVTQSDLVLILDADFIVKPYLISEALPYFQDEKVALVQYPQSFYNKDPLQLLNKRLYNEQDFFMRYMEPQIAAHNAMIHIGTNALIRRSALEEIGGVPTSSITEDMATGILLQNAGYQTIFINKAYALGIAPFRLKDFKSQRKRWASGTMQVFRRIHPLLLPGLSLKQKAIYLELYLYWFSSFQKLIFITIPTVFMVFGIPVVNMNAAQFGFIVIPVLLLFSLSFRILIGRVRTYNSSHIYDTLVAPYHAMAILQELFRPNNRFQVTPKDASKRSKSDLHPVIPHIVLTIWLIISLGIAGFKIGAGVSLLPLVVCAGWTFYNLYALAFSIAAAKSSNVDTAGEALSVSVDEKIICDGYELHVFQMSFDGIRTQKLPDGQNPFVVGQQCPVLVPRTGFTYTAQYNGDEKCCYEFLFVDIDRERAILMSKFYVTQLHAAKALDFDREAPDSASE